MHMRGAASGSDGRKMIRIMLWDTLSTKNFKKKKPTCLFFIQSKNLFEEILKDPGISLMSYCSFPQICQIS